MFGGFGIVPYLCIIKQTITNKKQRIMSKVEQLRSIIKDLPQSTIQGVLASNSVILYNRNTKEYAVYCGRLNPERTGTFQEIKEWLEQKVNC